jgi:thioredoxin 1
LPNDQGLELTKSQINGDEPVVVDFWATWCGPCKMISPHFAKMEEKYPGVKLVKVDVEEQEVRLHLQ